MVQAQPRVTTAQAPLVTASPTLTPAAKTPPLPTPLEATASHSVAATRMIRMTTRNQSMAKRTTAMMTITRRRNTMAARVTTTIAMMRRRGISVAAATAVADISSNSRLILEATEDVKSALNTL